MRVSVFRRCGVALALLALCSAIAAQQPELVIQTGESKFVYSVAFSADGKTLFSGGTYARQWDVQTGHDLGALGEGYFALGVATSARANLIATSMDRGVIKILDDTTRRERLTLDSGGRAIIALAFDAEGRRLAGACVNISREQEEILTETSIKIWELGSGKEPRTVTTYRGITFSLAFSPTGQHVAGVRVSKLEGGMAEAVVWDAQTGAELWSFVVDEEQDEKVGMYSVAFGAGGSVLAATGKEGVTLLSLSDGSKRKLEGTEQSNAVAFSPEGDVLAVGSPRTITLWQAGGWQQLWKKEEYGDHVFRIAFSPDGRTIASVDGNSVIKICEVATGRVLRSLTNHARSVEKCFFNPETKTITSRSEGIRRHSFWDLTTGRKAGNAGAAFDGTFSDDKKWLVQLERLGGIGNPTRERPRQLKIWDTVNSREVYDMTSPLLTIMSEEWALSKDGRFFAIGKEDGTLLLLNLETRKELLLGTPEDPSTASSPRVVFSLDGKSVITHEYTTVTKWETETGRKQLTFDVERQSSKLSPDGRRLASYGSSSDSVFVWDVASGALLYRLDKPSDVNTDLTFGPGGETIIVSNDDAATIDVWDARTGKRWQTLRGHAGLAHQVIISPDRKRVTARGNHSKLFLWDLTTGRLMREFQMPYREENFGFIAGGRLLFSPKEDFTIRLWDTWADREETLGEAELTSLIITDGKWMAVGGERVTKVYDSTDMTLRRTLGEDGQPVSPALLSEDGKRLITGDAKNFKLWDVESGRPLWAFPAALAPTFATFDFSDDGKFVLSGGRDGYLRIWDAVTGTLVASLVELGEADWAVVTPDGRFDASPGAFELMHWRIGGEVVAFSQLKERFYEPGLLAKVTGHSTEPLRDIASLKHVRLYPEVAYAVDAKDGYKLRVMLANRGGGIGPVQVFVNGKEVVADARDDKLRRNPQTPRASLTVDLRQSSFMPGQANSIRVYAWNYDEQTRREYISSRGAEVVWVPPGAAEKYEPTFYALIVGVSDYAGPALRLKYAAKDAEDMARALTLAGRRLFGPDRVRVKLLSTSQPQPSARPTKENIRLAFEEFRRSKPGDVLFIYFAGHGITLGRGSDSYLFLTQEARSNDSAILADEGVRRQTSVSGEELAAWINAVPALREAMVLDTCAAGAFGDRYQLKRTLSGDAIRAIEKLKDRTGFYILMGSAADASAYETSRYGQGLLTYSILQGMKGAALAPGGEVDVQTIFQYAADQVPLLARDIGGIQKPEIKIPRGGVSFPVGLLSDEDRRGIPLTNARPMILRPVLTDEQEGFDRLKLSRRLGDELREASFTSPATNAFVYVDAADIPDGFTPYGKYAVAGDSLRVTVKLVRNDAPVATFTVEGRADDLPALTQKLIEAIASKTRQLIN